MEKENNGTKNWALQYNNAGISGDLLFQQRIDRFITLYHASICESKHSGLATMFQSCECLYIEINSYLEEDEKNMIKSLLLECEKALPSAYSDHSSSISLVLTSCRQIMEFLVSKTHQLGFVRNLNSEANYGN